MKKFVGGKGVQSFASKLTDEQVKEIRMRIKMGETGAKLALEFNVSPKTISCINTGRTWNAKSLANSVQTS